MTAAVARPQQDLFSHLFASRPEGPDRSSFAATSASVVFHVGAVVALIWASSQIRPAVVSKPDDPVFVIPVAAPDQPAPAQSAAPASGSPAPTSPALAIPTPAMPDVPLPSSQVTTEFAEPGDNPGATTSPGNSTTPGANGTGAQPNGEGFVPVSVMPALLNADAVRKALERNYPALLRDAGIGGKAVVWLYIDETGSVVRAQIKESSGQGALDDVALKVAPLMRFSPAKNRDQAVKVMVAVPVVFTAR